jgi:hypothetical protein
MFFFPEKIIIYLEKSTYFQIKNIFDPKKREFLVQLQYWWNIPEKTQPCHPRFQIWMNFFMGNPPDVKSLFPEFFACGTSSFAWKNNEFKKKKFKMPEVGKKSIQIWNLGWHFWHFLDDFEKYSPTGPEFILFSYFVLIAFGL